MTLVSEAFLTSCRPQIILVLEVQAAVRLHVELSLSNLGQSLPPSKLTDSKLCTQNISDPEYASPTFVFSITHALSSWSYDSTAPLQTCVNISRGCAHQLGHAHSFLSIETMKLSLDCDTHKNTCSSWTGVISAPSVHLLTSAHTCLRSQAERFEVWIND